MPLPSLPPEDDVTDGAEISLRARFDHALAGRRLDQALTEVFPDYSRSRLRAWLDAGRITVNGAVPRAKDPVIGGETVVLVPEAAPRVEALPEALPLDVRHEDAEVLVLHKPAGFVVHPGAGNPSGTLMNALLHYDPRLAALPRAGIVHRLDKDTSGLMVVARTPRAYEGLVAQLSSRKVTREYEAICSGVMIGGGTVDAPIDRHEIDRLRMAVRRDGREAVTHYRVLQRFRAHTHVRVQLATGRTHQIRVHLTHIGYPLVGDPVYGKRLVVPRGADTLVAEGLRAFKRQALHAAHLAFVHPVSNGELAFDAPVPDDFAALLALLQGDLAKHPGEGTADVWR